MIDNAPQNLQAPGSRGAGLLVHGCHLRLPARLRPRRTLRSAAYEVGSLVSQTSLPRHVQFVWHGIDSPDSPELLDRSWGTEVP